MPKKTKKEKIIAQLRRKLETVKPADGIKDSYVIQKTSTENVASPPATSYQLPAIKYTPIEPAVLLNQSNLYIIKDLRKTFILATLAISFEIMVYWLTELGGNKLLKFLPMFK